MVVAQPLASVAVTELVKLDGIPAMVNTVALTGVTVAGAAAVTTIGVAHVIVIST
ncbi:MAG: hypothetical protein IPL33_10400 [Sphingobacteriales bacterium]|nr:hypothetical protein [Sphingobacteriales bacterium]